MVELRDGETVRSASSGCTWSRTPARSMHDRRPDAIYVDLNRAGIALMEIVSKPDMRSAEEAAAYVKKLRTILRYLGHLRRRHGEGQPARRRQRLGAAGRVEPLGTRCEIKNVNSFRYIGRPSSTRRAGRSRSSRTAATIDQETRLFDPEQGRDPLDALQGRGARLSLLPRSRPAAAGTSIRLRSRRSRRRCRNCPTPRRRASGAVRPVGLRRRGADHRTGDAPTSSRRPRQAATPSWPPTG